MLTSNQAQLAGAGHSRGPCSQHAARYSGTSTRHEGDVDHKNIRLENAIGCALPQVTLKKLGRYLA
jgi:hypothetical protein